jgi:hypothetical protein
MCVPILATASDDFGFTFAFEINHDVFDVLVFCEGKDYFACDSVTGNEEPRLELLSIRTLLNEDSETVNHCSEVDIELVGRSREKESASNGLKEINLNKRETKPR